MIVKKEKLQAYLNERGLSQKKFAAKLGVDVTEVEKCFRANR